MPRSLGRIYSPDPRDANYPMASHLGAAPAGKPHGRILHDVPVRYDQGQTPECVGYSTATSETARLAAFYGPEVSLDAAAIYAWANAHDGDPTPHDGSSVRAGFDAMVTVGGHVTGDVDRAPWIKGEVTGEYVKATKYLWADLTNIETAMDEITRWLLTVGTLVVGIPWYSDSFCEDGTGTFIAPPNGLLPITGSLAGGHAICIRGVNADDPVSPFVFRNTWRPWGLTVAQDFSLDTTTPDGGDILISRDNLANLLSQQGEAGALIAT